MAENKQNCIIDFMIFAILKDKIAIIYVHFCKGIY